MFFDFLFVISLLLSMRLFLRLLLCLWFVISLLLSMFLLLWLFVGESSLIHFLMMVVALLFSMRLFGILTRLMLVHRKFHRWNVLDYFNLGACTAQERRPRRAVNDEGIGFDFDLFGIIKSTILDKFNQFRRKDM